MHWSTNNIYEYAPDGTRTLLSPPAWTNPTPLRSTSTATSSSRTAAPAISMNSPGGARTTFASGLTYPNGLAFDSSGDLYVGDQSFYKFTPGGTQSTFASGKPIALAFDSSGNLYAKDPFYIYEFAPNATRSNLRRFRRRVTTSMAFSSSGNLFATGEASGNVYEFAPDGARTTFASGLTDATGLAIGSNGNLYVADGSLGNIYEYTPGGVQSTFATGSAGPSTWHSPPVPPNPPRSSCWARGGGPVWLPLRMAKTEAFSRTRRGIGPRRRGGNRFARGRPRRPVRAVAASGAARRAA